MNSPATTDELLPRICSGDMRALARAATLVENRTPEGYKLLAQLFAQTGHATVIGITGAPGVGKSTLVDQLIRLLRQKARRTGVIAIDPSSPYSRGAILGDRIRMGTHYSDPGVFIRSLATRGHVGGITHGTLDLAFLMDAAGYDYVLIETVGVGQDEIDVARLADVTAVVLVPGMGDDIQAMKAGIMEIADVFVVNKADQPGAERLEQEIRFAQMLAHSPGSPVPICRVAASTGWRMEELFSEIELSARNQKNATRQVEQWKHRLRSILRERLLESIPSDQWAKHAELVARRLEDPYTAVAALRHYLGESV